MDRHDTCLENEMNALFAYLASLVWVCETDAVVSVAPDWFSDVMIGCKSVPFRRFFPPLVLLFVFAALMTTCFAFCAAAAACLACSPFPTLPPEAGGAFEVFVAVVLLIFVAWLML